MSHLGNCHLRGEKLRIEHVGYYADGTRAINLFERDGAPFGRLTVCVEGAVLAPDEILVKTWSENEEMAAAALNSIEKLFNDTGHRMRTGFCEAQIWKLTELAMSRLEE